MLTWLLPAAMAASSSWTATCSTKDDASVWFVFAQAPDAPAQTDFDCKGLFFENVACTQSVGIGKIKPTGVSSTGHPQYELRYLPYGDVTSIVTFLNAPGGGVVYKLPPPPPGQTYASTPPPPKPNELLKLYLDQRAKASAATKNVTLHVWSCPDAQFFPPEEAIKPYGTVLAEHVGRIAPPTQ
ncbi:MAG: hypothetical protein ACOZNI_10775 [Myxococcota bacterium]